MSFQIGEIVSALCPIDNKHYQATIISYDKGNDAYEVEFLEGPLKYNTKVVEAYHIR